MKYLTIEKALEAWQQLQPLTEDDRNRLSRRFTVDFNYNSNHIEGNTLTYGQTEILLLFGKVIGEANVKDVQDMTASNVALKMVNFILARHGYPMIVVRSRNKSEYLEALHSADLVVGSEPSQGAHASLQEIAPFMKYFRGLVAREVYTDVCFLSESDERLWWYDGERVEFRTVNYPHLLRLMLSEPILTLEDMQKRLGVNMSAVKKLVAQLLSKHYIERGTAEGSWRVFLTPSV